MQQQLNEAARMQRDVFAVTRLGKRTRKACHPDLYLKARPFCTASFDEQKAYELLAQAIYPRKVSSSGAITLYSKSFSVGTKHKGEITLCTFSPKEAAWICMDRNQNILKVIADERFSRDQLFHLTVYQ